MARPVQSPDHSHTAPCTWVGTDAGQKDLQVGSLVPSYANHCGGAGQACELKTRDESESAGPLGAEARASGKVLGVSALRQ